MLSSVLFVSLSLASTALATADVSTSYLPNIVNGATGISAKLCQPFEDAVTACVNSDDTSNQGLAACSCKGSFLKLLRACSDAEDSMNNNKYASGQYSGFCQQCVTIGFQKLEFCPQAAIVHDVKPDTTTTTSSNTSSSSSSSSSSTSTASSSTSSSTSVVPSSSSSSTSASSSSSTSSTLIATSTPSSSSSASLSAVDSSTSVLPSSTFSTVTLSSSSTPSSDISTVIDTPSSTVIVDIGASPTVSVDDSTVVTQVFVEASSVATPQETLVYSSAGKVNVAFYSSAFIGLVGVGLLL